MLCILKTAIMWNTLVIDHCSKGSTQFLSFFQAQTGKNIHNIYKRIMNFHISVAMAVTENYTGKTSNLKIRCTTPELWSIYFLTEAHTIQLYFSAMYSNLMFTLFYNEQCSHSNRNLAMKL